jgi:signal-transduction protein with cAMP-binding, CBS, and nucleotidyltransferase domain
MTLEAVCCFETEPLSTAAHLMRRWQIRRVLVVDRMGALAGILTLTDIALNSREPRLAGDILSAILKSTGALRQYDQNLNVTPAVARQ